MFDDEDQDARKNSKFSAIVGKSIIQAASTERGLPVILYDPRYVKNGSIDLNNESFSDYLDDINTLLKIPLTEENLQFFSLTKKHERDLKDGQAVITFLKAIRHTPKRTSGGQMNTTDEKKIKDSLAVTVFAVVERLVALIQIRDGTSGQPIKVQRENVIDFIAEDWPESDERYEEPDRHTKRLDTLWTYGRHRELWIRYYPTEDIQQNISRWLQWFKCASKEKLNEEIEFQRSLVIAMLRLEFRAQEIRKTVGLVSDKARKDVAESPGHRAKLAGNYPDSRGYYSDLLPAAFASEINPSDFYPNLEIGRQIFEVVGLIGRVYRRTETTNFSLENILIISRALTNLKKWNLQKWPENTQELKELAFWAKALDAVMEENQWEKFIIKALSFPNVRRGESLVCISFKKVL